jgi:hypothetical protein
MMRDAVPVSRHAISRLVGIGSLLLVVVSAAVTYWATLASQSSGPANAYPGWITVLEPTSSRTSVQIRLSVDALSNGSHPRLAYGLAVCGTGSFSGYLLAGGASVLSDESVDAAPHTVRDPITKNLHASDPFSSRSQSLGPVQVWRFKFTDLPKCIGTAAAREFSGTGFRVEGLPPRPVRLSERFGPLQSSTETWAMPYVGNLPGAGQNLGEFELSGVISGSFLRPVALASDVDAGPVPLSQTMREARPTTVHNDRAQWHEEYPFQATVRVEDSSSSALLQRLSTISSIVLGLAGAILTAFAFELVRGRPSSGEAPAANRGPEEPVNAHRRHGRDPGAQFRLRWPAIVLTAIFAAVVRLVVRRRSLSD